MSAITEDKEFSFCLRDKLLKYCDDNNIILSFSNPLRNQKMLLDMIVYSSMGDTEQGLENIKETHNFLMTCLDLGHNFFFEFSGMKRPDDLMWEFWKSCFIRVKMALASGKRDQIAACTDYSRYPRGYAAHVQNFVGSDDQLYNYFEDQIRIWANDSRGVNDSLNIRHE